MNKGIAFVKYAALGTLLFCLFIFGLAVLDIQLISILIGLVYLIFLVLTKTTSYFSKRLFLIRYEKTVALIVLFIISILQVTIKNLDPVVPILLMAFTTMAIGYLIFSWIYEKIIIIRKLKVEKLEAELKFLKHQINPHFFFNTLNNLYGLALDKADEAPDFIQKLSELMRYVIEQGANEKVNIADEISYMRNYVDLQMIRYQTKPRFDFTIDLQDETKRIAPLLLTNLIENAFKHGLDHLRSEAFLSIQLLTTTNVFSFCIENNFVEQQHKNHIGIGLENLKRRLDLVYPDRHDLEINTSSDTFKATLTINFDS